MSQTVKEGQEQLNEDPLVSISCITFNHAPYIRQCLEGFLMQKTNFKIEVLIHDDASTDGTEEIIREYESQYPDIIKPLYEKENQWVKGRRGSKVFNFPRAKGKYMALCEGDDYWTDPLKLQKQVDFLEVNPGYAFCFHSAEVVTELDNIYQNFNVTLETRKYTGEEILRRWTVPTASVVYRNYDYRSIPTDHRFLFGDIILFLWLAEKGKIYCINESMSVYRRHEGGVVLKEKIPYQKTIAHYTAINEHFGKKYNKVLRQLKAGVLARTLFFEKNSIRESFNILAYIITRPKLIYSFCRNLYHLIRKSL